MRFSHEGPSIPDELLIARDEGRVIFFCGAGVSRARAGLPDFFELARKVIEELGTSSDSPARKIMEEARRIESIVGLGGLVSADRVLGILEREFLTTDLHGAVAKALKPTPNADLSSHRIILDLARWPDGKVRLVTTNFDRLFESCDPNLRPWIAPRLPSPEHYEDFEGIIHLHGCVDQSYAGAEGGGFVVSSADFGRAYLSDGWATEFIQAILNKYVVVFVGYTADDPPVQYLLEALNRGVESRQGLYAFQAGTESDALGKWLHKGVQPIAYNETDHHKSLWEMLTAWATRAKDPDAWYENVIALARRGPEALLPYERGKVAHIVSTYEGMKKFAASDAPPPAEWLCVFDPNIRYGKPRHQFDSNWDEQYFDPFPAYSLDNDPVPANVDPNDYYAKRETPKDVWDCFAATVKDLHNLDNSNFPAFRGHWAAHVPHLPHRLARLGIWLAKVCNEPAAVWWMAGQTGLHPDIESDIRLQMERDATSSSTEIRKAWRYIFEAIESPKITPYRRFELESSIKTDGWSTTIVRQLAQLCRPRFVVQRSSDRPKPPQRGTEFRIRDLVHVDVNYPELLHDFVIPDNYLNFALKEFRKNLEYAVGLETEIGGAGLILLVPIEPDPELQRISFGTPYKISGPLLYYVNLYKRLVPLNIQAARLERLAWPVDDPIFTALRIWVAGDQRIVSADEAGEILSGLTDENFWHSRYERDLLLALSRRWSEFSQLEKIRLGTRLLNGPPQWDAEPADQYERRRAADSLNCICWLHSQGCLFEFDIESESAKLHQLAPEWRPEYAKAAVASTEPRGGIVTTNTDFDELLNVRLGEILDKAKKIREQPDDLLVDKNPFAGLASARPVMTLSALSLAAKKDDYPKWAWHILLTQDTRKTDKPKFSALIAARLARLPRPVLAENIHSVCDWLLITGKAILNSFPTHFATLWDQLVSVLQSNPEIAKSGIVRGSRQPDWPFEALNAPVGKLAQVLLNNSTLDETENFASHWIARINELLSLAGDLRRHALVMFSHHLNWFFGLDPEWTERNLLIAAQNQNRDDHNAFWAGFLWAGQRPDPDLFNRIKPQLLMLTKDSNFATHQNVAGLILSGWLNIDGVVQSRSVTDKEMRDVLISASDDFRGHVLWHLENITEKQPPDNWSEQLSAFLTQVWPRQKSVKTPLMTAKLCNLALAATAVFPDVIDAILPLVTKLDEHARHGLILLNETVRDPEKTLALLFAVLPENASIWPYGIDRFLEEIPTQRPLLLNDPRLIELKRRWNSR